MTRQIMWEDQYLVGGDEIDAQHKALFDLYNGLQIAHKAGDQSIVSHAFEELATYLDKHFSAEEVFWQRDDAMYKEHRKLHFDFVKHILRATGDGKNLESLGGLLDFLSTWLIDHVQTVDKIQFEELRARGLL